MEDLILDKWHNTSDHYMNFCHKVNLGMYFDIPITCFQDSHGSTYFEV